MPNKIINNIFQSFQKHLDDEQEIRDTIRTTVKEIETISREIITILQVIHSVTNTPETENSVAQSCLKARELFEQVRTGYESLTKIVPDGQYYRYNDHWRYVTQRLCFAAALIVFLEAGFLISRETAATLLGIHDIAKKGFHLDIEDYLIGVLQLSSELARFAVNAVTNGDYSRPLQISHFVADINAGFRLLNLKNDSLRKRFDVLKYDVKKIEEVVYDLSIRGLKQ